MNDGDFRRIGVRISDFVVVGRPPILNMFNSYLPIQSAEKHKQIQKNHWRIGKYECLAIPTCQGTVLDVLREDVKMHNHWLQTKCCSIQWLSIALTSSAQRAQNHFSPGLHKRLLTTEKKSRKQPWLSSN